MGGIGSGVRSPADVKAIVTEYNSIDVRRWKREGFLEPGKEFGWGWTHRDGSLSSINVWVGYGQVTVKYRWRNREDVDWNDVEVPIVLDSTPCNLGGDRVWFRCPGKSCGRRVAKLYIGSSFLCRDCLNLTYLSTRENEYWRQYSKAKKIRVRLGGSGSLLDSFPAKPKGMWWKTYWQLWERVQGYETAGAQMQFQHLTRQMAQLFSL